MMTSRTYTSVQYTQPQTQSHNPILELDEKNKTVPSLLDMCVQTLVRAEGMAMRKVDHVFPRLPEEMAQFLLVALAEHGKVTDDRLCAFLSISRRVIRLAGCGGIRKSVLRQIPFRCPHLTYLDLSNCTQVSNTVVRDILQGCSKLQQLRLDNCRHITDAAFQPDQSLFYPLLASLSLKVLSLAGCSQITHSLIMYILKSYRSLKELNLSRCKRITNESVKTLLTSSIHLRLRVLNLSFTEITDEALSSISMTDLHEIDLGCTKITDAILFSLAKHCPRLEVIRLRYCSQITDTGVARLAACYPNLQHIDITNCGLLTDLSISALGQCHHLQSLKMAWCVNITDIGVDDLAKGCTELEEIVWTYCSQLTNASLESLQRYCPRLRSIHLNGCSSILKREQVGETILFIR